MRRLVVLCLATALLGVAPVDAAPSNDDRANAQPLRFGGWHSADVPDGTIEPGEDLSCLDAVQLMTPLTNPQTFWYSFEAETDLVIHVRADAEGPRTPTGLGLFEAEATMPLACGSLSEGTVLRWAVERGHTYELQVSCRCDATQSIIRGGFFTAAIVAPNDDISDAASVTLPFADHPFLAPASVDHHSSRCDYPGLDVEGSPVDTTPSIAYRSNRNVWYRFAAPEDDAVLIEAFRYVSAPYLNIYVESETGLALLQCRSPEWRTSEYSAYREYARALVHVVAGRVYYFELIEGGQGIPERADLWIRLAPRADVSVDAVRVGPAASETETVRTVTVELGTTGRTGPASLLTLSACPPGGSAEACVLVGEDYPGWMEVNPVPGSISFEWDTLGCFGDVELRASLSSPYTIDPDPANDHRTEAVALVGGSQGIGGGPCGLFGFSSFIPRDL